MKFTTKKKQFLNSLKRGTGEAYLILKNNAEIDFSEEIIQGALNIYAYDGQSEGNRAQYVYDIISQSNHKDKIRKAVLQGLVNEQEQTWNLTHLFALVKLYAKQNDNEARQSMYDRFLNPPIEYSDWVGAYEILELDGLNGLLYVAEKFGKYIEKNPDDIQDDWIIKRFQDENSDIKVYDELQKNAETNKYIRIYLDNIKRTKERQESNKRKSVKYDNIIDEVINGISFFRIRKLKKKELKLIAEQLIIETDEERIEKFLKVFNYHKFPLDNSCILNFAKQNNNKDIADNAIDALKHLKSREIREFAIEQIENSKRPIDFIPIIISNYKKGDAHLLTNIAKRVRSEEKIEQLAYVFTDIYTTNKTKECKEPLEILYNKMNCAIHRNGIIEILINNKVLSDKINEEIQFDCDLETRKLYKKTADNN